MEYDLNERTAIFAENIIELCKKFPKNCISLPLINQIIRSGTSVGANYCEANGASSKKDFRMKILFCKKEILETKYWLRMLIKADDKLDNDCKNLWKEAHELTLIFSKIAYNTK